MKHKRLIVLVFLILFISIGVFCIYKNTYKDTLNYVALGDSVAAGRNPYGVDDYGYTDYIYDYLKGKDKLNNYVNYAVSGYTISNVMDDINYNKIVKVNGKNIGIKKALRESDLVTISIGANDLLNGMSLSSIPLILTDRTATTQHINSIIDKIEDLLELVKKYAKGDIIVVGYYNPLPNLTKYKQGINEIIDYVDIEYVNLCNSMDIHYVKISDVIASNKDYLPNSLDIHLSKTGYEAISKEVIETIENKVFK